MSESKQDQPKAGGTPPPAPQTQQQPVTVMGTPQAAAAPAAAEPTPTRPDPAKADETTPGGLYIREDRQTVVDAEGRVVEGYTVKDGAIVEGGSRKKKADDKD